MDNDVSPVSIPAPISSSSRSSGGTALRGPIELFKAAYELYKDIWGKLLVINLIPAAVAICGLILAGISLLVGLWPLAVAVWILVTGAVIFVVIMNVAATIHIIDTKSKGADCAVKDAYYSNFSIFWSLLLVYLICIVVWLGSYVLLIIPGIYVGVSISFAFFARVIDGKTGLSALAESQRLVSGRWWTVFGRLFAVGVMLGVLTIAVSIILGILPLGQLASDLFVAGFVAPMAVIYNYYLYSDLKDTATSATARPAFSKLMTVFIVVGILAAIVFPMISVAGFLAIMDNLHSSAPVPNSSM
ncbi:MAG: hypothetical protein KGJ33_03400 [Patescibacteria group bacterium]|nr:hypothetical protein [Patescibacteria group bacterium]